jgi:hypothetical protein
MTDMLELDVGSTRKSPVLLRVPVREYWGDGELSAGSMSWKRCGEKTWKCSDSKAIYTASLEDGAGTRRRLRLTMAVTSAVAVRRCSVTLTMETRAAPRFLGPDYRWRELQDSCFLSEMTPLVGRIHCNTGSVIEIRSSGIGVAAALKASATAVSLELLLDAAALHPRWNFRGGRHSRAAPPLMPGETRSLELELLELAPDEILGTPAVPARLPHGSEAAFVITDHPDFDTVDRVAKLLHGDGGARGWLGRGLRITKGAFAVPSSPPGKSPAPTLEEQGYRRLMSQLHDEGSEIAPHALSEWGTLPPSEFHRALDAFAKSWRPRTWIDHGVTIDYCYTMGGDQRPEYSLLTRLHEAGVDTLWAYEDVPSNATASLNMLMPPAADIVGTLPAVTEHALRGEVLVVLHYLRCWIDHRVHGPRGDLVRMTIANARGFASAVAKGPANIPPAARDVVRRMKPWVARAGSRDVSLRVPYSRNEMLACAPSVYPESGMPLRNLQPEGARLFATSLVTHVTDAYTPERLALLKSERGLHIGHCYLAHSVEYLAGIFVAGECNRLSKHWSGFLDSLQAHSADASIWNPTMAALSGWIADRLGIDFAPSGPHSATIGNRNGHVVNEFTVLLPPETRPDTVRWENSSPAGYRSWGDWVAVWGDLPAHGCVRVAWG